MISVGFSRVSKKRPCRICGKPTYCGFSRDEGTSICMRISAGSRGLSRNGGNIHVHTEIPFITIRPTIKRPISQPVSPAPLEIRDAVFQELIRISPLQNTWRNSSLPATLSYGFLLPFPLTFAFAFSGAFGTWPPPDDVCLRSCFDAPLDCCFAGLPTCSPCGCCCALRSAFV